MTTPTKPTALARRSLLAALATLPAFVTMPGLRAADATWDLDAGGTFSTASNWTGDALPGSDTGSTSLDIATFDRGFFTTTGTKTINLDASRNLAGITFKNDGGTIAIQLAGASVGAATAGTLTLSAGAVIQNVGSSTSITAINELDVAMVLAGNATITNTHGNSVFRHGMSSGNSANTVTTLADKGAITLTYSGTSTASNLTSAKFSEASGTTIKVVKEGTGTWQFNGPATGSVGYTGGLEVREGVAVMGRNNFGTNAVTLGGTTGSGNATISLGSINFSRPISVQTGSSGLAIISRLGGSAGTFSGEINLARDLDIRQGGAANNTTALNITGGIVGTGDVRFSNQTGTGIGVITVSTAAINNTGKVINQALAGNGITIASVIGANVTEVVQNSAVTLSLSNAGNLFGATTVSLGTLSVTGSGTLGTANVTVSSGATLTLANAAAIADAASLFFGSTATVNLNFTGAETVNMLSMINGSYIAPGSYNAAALNSYFGGSVFAGTGSLNVLSTIPEPSSFAALAGLAMLGFSATRRRARRY
jgi:hypothetical protein